MHRDEKNTLEGRGDGWLHASVENDFNCSSCYFPVFIPSRPCQQQPKLFDGVEFFLHEDYTKSYRGYLQDLVVAAGGTVLQRKPVSRNQQKLLDDSSLILIVYSIENQDKAKPRSRDGINTNRSQSWLWPVPLVAKL